MMNHEEEKNTKLLEQGPIITSAPSIVFDDILQQIGPFGWSQRIVYIITSLFDVLIACQLMFFLFGGGNPGWYCIPASADQLVLNGSSYNNLSSTSGTPSGFLEVMETRPRGLLAESITSRHLVKPEWDGVCSINGSRCARVVFKPGSTIVTEFSLTCDMKYASTFCTTMSMVGILFGAAVGGQLADLFGRRPIFFCIAFLMLLCQFGQSFADSWQMFAGFRFCAGFLSGGFMIVTYIIPLEVVGRQWRTVCGCIGFWQLGQMAFAGLAALIPNWRHLSLASAAICTPLLLAWFFVPESPRWLIQKNRLPEAHAILSRMAKRNGRAPPSETLLKQINTESKSESNEKYSFFDLFRGRQYTIRSLVMFYLWFSCTMTYYGLSLNARDISNDVTINILIMGVCELGFVLSVIYSSYRFGRRPALLFYFSFTCCCLVAAMVLNLTKSSVMAQSILGSLGRGSLSAAWGVAYLLSAELFPTVIRAIACGSSSVAGRIGGILAPQIAYMRFVHPVIPGMVYASLAVIALVLAGLFLPETKGTSLSDTFSSKGTCCSPPEPEIEEEKCVVTLGHQTADPTAV